jgi:ankyrin repeat protein
MYQIPVEILYLIVIGLLDSPSSLFALRSVNRKFNALLSKPLYLKLFEEAAYLSLRKDKRFISNPSCTLFAALGNIEAFACLVHSKLYNLNIKHERNGSTLLIFAVDHQIISAVKILLMNNVEIGSFDNYGYSALHKAALNGNCGIMRLLMQHGADLNSSNSQGETPLHLSAKKGHLDACKLLLSYKDIKSGSGASKFNRTPFHYLMTGNPTFKIVKLFSIECRSSMYKRDCNGYTLLHLAAINGCNGESAQGLIDAGIDVDDVDLNGNTALHFAIIYDNAEVVKILVDNGCNIYKRNAQSIRPIDQVADENLSTVNMRKLMIGGISLPQIGVLAILIFTGKQLLQFTSC